jgi:hypothetical protein
MWASIIQIPSAISCGAVIWGMRPSACTYPATSSGHGTKRLHRDSVGVGSADFPFRLPPPERSERASEEEYAMAKKPAERMAKKPSGRNCVELDGELARCVEVKELPSGSVLATLTVRIPSTDTRRTSVPVTVWGPTEAVKGAREGRRVQVSGRLVRRFWRGDDGSARSRVEVVADRVRVR